MRAAAPLQVSLFARRGYAGGGRRRADPLFRGNIAGDPGLKPCELVGRRALVTSRGKSRPCTIALENIYIQLKNLI